MSDEKKSWFKKTLEKYDQFCEELGVNRGACRGCVPVAKFDPEPESRMKKEKKEVRYQQCQVTQQESDIMEKK